MPSWINICLGEKQLGNQVLHANLETTAMNHRIGNEGAPDESKQFYGNFTF
jgi:hypothetical protein